MLHKTDGSHTNRPFPRSIQDVRENVFSQIDQLSRNVFCFFSSRKEIVPLLFFLEEKNGQLAREAQALRRTDAGTSCVVVGRNTTAGMPPSSALSLPVSAAPARQLSRANRPRKRKSIAEQLSFCAPAVFANVLHKTDGSNANRPFFLFRAGHAGKHLFTDKSTAPQCLLFLFFKKRNRSPLEEKKSFPPLVSPSHGAGVTAGAGLIVGSSCARYASTISSTDSSFRMMEISMRRLRVRPASVAFVSTGRVAP